MDKTAAFANNPHEKFFASFLPFEGISISFSPITRSACPLVYA